MLSNSHDSRQKRVVIGLPAIEVGISPQEVGERTLVVREVGRFEHGTFASHFGYTT